jgi:hypothetical protein
MNNFNATKNVTTLNKMKVIPEGEKRGRERDKKERKRKSMNCSPS